MIARVRSNRCGMYPPIKSWFWAWLMGLAMVIGGAMAMIVATTRVVLPYDEMMSGLTRQQLLEINERLLAFMTHDRVTLSGTMLATQVPGSTLVTIPMSGSTISVRNAISPGALIATSSTMSPLAVDSRS